MDYGLLRYIEETNDAFEKGIPSNFGVAPSTPVTPSALTRGRKNTVVRWRTYQGDYYDGPTNQIPRFLNARKIVLTNSGGTRVVVEFWVQPRTSAIPVPIEPGQTISLGINLRDEPIQYVDAVDPVTKKVIGITREIPSDAGELVLREGSSGWWFQTFKRSVW